MRESAMTRGADRNESRPGTAPALKLGLALALALGACGTAAAGEEPVAAGEPVAVLDGVAEAYEAVRWLPPDQRSPALDQTELSLAKVLRGHLDDERRMHARFLSGRILLDRGEYGQAEQAFRAAARGAGSSSRLADDAEFAAIEALEAAGDDAGAAREWVRWEKRYPQSGLVPAARLAQAWNMVRRGETAAAQGMLDRLAKSHAWIRSHASFVLARASAAYVAGRPADALEALGPRPEGARAAYLRGLCLTAQGSLLKAAAAFQEAAERDPATPLRDQALYAKANTFLLARDFRSAAGEFARVAGRVENAELRAECELRAGAAVYLSGAPDSALALLRELAERRAGTDVAARAQFLVGECLMTRGRHAEAIVEFNRVLKDYFQRSVAASAQYQVARCLDAMGRRGDATGSYQAVVSGYPLEPEAPAAAYLAGVGLLETEKPLAAAPYFQLVLDRYAGRTGEGGVPVFARPEHQELVEAALCLLELSYHRAGNLGQLAGAPHLLLTRMPPSRSSWRAWALLIDADASAAQARYDEARATLEQLAREFPDHAVNAHATKLLAWTHARQGNDSLAIATEERLLARWGADAQSEIVSAAFLDIAHERFNQKRYRESAAAYEDFLRRFPAHPRRAEAQYQAGLCYMRLDRAGDAVDRWESIVRDGPTSSFAERAWARAGDAYFQAAKYADAKRCYDGLLQNFAGSSAASIASLRLAQCAYNAGQDATALEGFSNTIARYPGTPAAREATRGQERSLYRLSQAPDGATTLARLVEQYPTSAFAADAQFQIARRAYQEKRWTEAAEGFRRVVSQFPGYSGADNAQYLLADALAEAGAADESRQALEQFLAFFPESSLLPSAHFRLGVLSFAQKDYMAAAIAFTRTLEDSAADEIRAPARYNLALCQRQLGRPEEAHQELEAYRRDFPGDARAAEVAFQLGDLLEASGRMEEAIAEFEQALAAHPSAALKVEASYRLGRGREQRGDVDGALRSYEVALAGQDRDDAWRLSAVARCAALYESRKEYTKAVAAYRDIMRNARDQELVAVATDRVSQLESRTKRR
jgi:TolA-binding protein